MKLRKALVPILLLEAIIEEDLDPIIGKNRQKKQYKVRTYIQYKSLLSQESQVLLKSRFRDSQKNLATCS